MQSLLIQDNKAFMRHLLVLPSFDSFELVSAQLTTFCTFTVAGDYIPGFLSEESAPPAAGSFALWHMVRPHMLDLIKGKNKPGSMHIVLRLSNANTEKVLHSSGTGQNPSDVAGLYWNISYQHKDSEEKITCVPGVSLRIFSMDKRLEHVWDEMTGKYLKKLQIPFKPL